MKLDYVYSGVAYRGRREQRMLAVVTIGLVLLTVEAVLWATGFALRGNWHLSAVHVAVAVAGVVTLALRRRADIRVLIHAGLALALVYIWLIALLAEGITKPGAGVTHYWFVVALTGAMLLFLGEPRRYTILYGGACALSFLVCELGLIQSAPALDMVRDPQSQTVMRIANHISVFVALLLLIAVFIREIADAERQLGHANSRLEALLENMLPASISQRLRREGRTFADGYADCSVLFADIVGFTSLAAATPPASLVNLLDGIFSRFDEATDRHGLEKIKTIGDAYMVAAGLPHPRPDHAVAICRLAVEMLDTVASFPGLQLRIGINSGAVVAGIIGRKRFVYDLWGDTVNIASRMESQGLPGTVQVSESTWLLARDHFDFEPRGDVHLKGRGPMPVYVLTSPRRAAGAATAATASPPA
jgi:guanylate cyclase